jgi:5-methylthioadenosine/S-adenosylhomocysteine deaminase
MRRAALAAKFRESDTRALPALEVLRLATRGSAAALGLGDEVGSIELGKRADIIAVDLNSPHLWPLFNDADSVGNLVEQLVYAARASDVRFSMVDGRVLMSDGRVRTLDQDEIREMVEEQSRDLARRAGVESSVVRRGPKTVVNATY